MEQNRSLIVDEPIINSPFEEPRFHWRYSDDTGTPVKERSRRPANYYSRSQSSKRIGQANLFSPDEMVQLELADKIRASVKQWRDGGYQGISHISGQLLRHWTAPERERKLFFCQIEAIETLIWLVEVNKQQLKIPKDKPHDPGFPALTRYCMKMATGSGKTVVMAMIIAWSVLNKVHNRKKKEFSDAILIVTPNLTVKERLGGVVKPDADDNNLNRALIPGAKGNYYDDFDLVPSALKGALGQGKIFITNWHQFAEKNDSEKRGYPQRGEESSNAFANRVLKPLGSAKNILVINDEAHHAYRPAGSATLFHSKTIRSDIQQATIWVSGLDKINDARKISMVLDLSATPYYIQGSGYPEGSPLPWIISDFGLVDAIECGIVKIPQIPTDTDSGRPVPEYYALWQWINEKLPPSQRATAARKPKPEAILREAEGALVQLAGQWKKAFEEFQKENREIPPVMIVVCDNTDIAQIVHEYISGERWEEYSDEKGKKQKRKVFGTGKLFPELLSNTPEKEYTIRIDSKLLSEAESNEGNTKKEAAEVLRKKVSTVGKAGEPGQHVRCVVSVSMLTEGWDARNVTQILGLRAFLSQLLCEQVVGRGLRRIQYDDMTVPEYVDVYGIPFEVIPVRKKPVKQPETVETKLVQALPDREALMIEFPRVEGFVYQVKHKITADLTNIESITIAPNVQPTEMIVGSLIPGTREKQTREEFYKSIRLQQIHYAIALQITAALLNQEDFKMQARNALFPQVLRMVKAYVKPFEKGGKIKYEGADQRELGLEIYTQRVVERLCNAIRPDKSAGEAPLLPRLERFRPRGSTKEVLFRTARETKPTIKSHVNRVVFDNFRWESIVVYHLEQSDLVVSYAKNDHLGLSIEYQFGASQHAYLPDFVVKLTNGKTILLEVKGHESQQDLEKYEAAKRWCEAVSNWGKMGVWMFEVCKDPHKTNEILQRVASSGGVHVGRK